MSIICPEIVEKVGESVATSLDQVVAQWCYHWVYPANSVYATGTLLLHKNLLHIGHLTVSSTTSGSTHVCPFVTVCSFNWCP